MIQDLNRCGSYRYSFYFYNEFPQLSGLGPVRYQTNGRLNDILLRTIICRQMYSVIRNLCEKSRGQTIVPQYIILIRNLSSGWTMNSRRGHKSSFLKFHNERNQSQYSGSTWSQNIKTIFLSSRIFLRSISQLTVKM